MRLPMLMIFLHFSLGDQLLNLLKQNCTERERCIFAEHAKSVKKDSNLEILIWKTTTIVQIKLNRSMKIRPRREKNLSYRNDHRVILHDLCNKILEMKF